MPEIELGNKTGAAVPEAVQDVVHSPAQPLEIVWLFTKSSERSGPYCTFGRLSRHLRRAGPVMVLEGQSKLCLTGTRDRCDAASPSAMSRAVATASGAEI